MPHLLVCYMATRWLVGFVPDKYAAAIVPQKPSVAILAAVKFPLGFHGYADCATHDNPVLMRREVRVVCAPGRGGRV